LKRIKALQGALRIETIADLKAACEKGLVKSVNGFGPKREAKILAAIEKLETTEQRTLLNHALGQAEQLLEYLHAAPKVLQANIAGALRRRKESARRIQLVAATEEPEAVLDYFQRYPAALRSLEQSARRCKVRLTRGLDAELHMVPPRDYAAALHRLTGSAKHLTKLEAIARGMSIDAHGLPSLQRLDIKEEGQIYGHLGMQYIPPELREDEGEIEAALAGALPNLVAAEDIQGAVHCHTVYSDGKNTIEEMALAADAMGMKYLTITDHSPSAYYARGVKPDRLKVQWEEIARVQEKVKVRLLKGTESDILEDGSLDYPDAILEQFDIILASIHVRAKMDVEQMTRRLLAAMKSPFFKVWGHPLGRMILSRPPLECHMDQVLDAIAGSAAAIEVNGDPRRVDLEPKWVRAARRRGIKFVISTDAHSVKGLQNLRYGVYMARRAWLTREEVLNTQETQDFMKAVRP
jgi:DNA polymerase (family 10)